MTPVLCSAKISGSILKDTGNTYFINQLLKHNGHQHKVVGFGNQSLIQATITSSGQDLSRFTSPKRSLSHPFPIIEHDVVNCQEVITQAAPLHSSAKHVKGSNKSLWVSVAVVISALFAIAMVARFGGGMGISTNSATIFAGVTGGALGLYAFSALSNYCNNTQKPHVESI